MTKEVVIDGVRYVPVVPDSPIEPVTFWLCIGRNGGDPTIHHVEQSGTRTGRVQYKFERFSNDMWSVGRVRK